MGVSKGGGGVPAGTVEWFAASTPPTGYIKANGAAVSRTLYAALFNAIGTTHGVGDGSTTFNVPDLRGEFIRGLDDGRGVDTGRAMGSAQAGQFGQHTHVQQSLTGTGSANGYGPSSAYSATAAATAASTAAAGGTGNGSETRPRNVAMLPCIKF